MTPYHNKTASVRETDAKYVGAFIMCKRGIINHSQLGVCRQ